MFVHIIFILVNNDENEECRHGLRDWKKVFLGLAIVIGILGIIVGIIILAIKLHNRHPGLKNSFNILPKFKAR